MVLLYQELMNWGRGADISRTSTPSSIFRRQPRYGSCSFSRSLSRDEETWATTCERRKPRLDPLKDRRLEMIRMDVNPPADYILYRPWRPRRGAQMIRQAPSGG